MKRYAIRFSSEAEQNAIAEAHSLFTFTGEQEAGLALHDAFYQAAGALVTLPDRHPIRERESYLLGAEVRCLLVRGRFQLFYRIEEKQDGPVVVVMYIRSGFRAELTEAEALAISQNQR